MKIQHIMFHTKLDELTQQCVSTYIKNLTVIDRYVRNIELYDNYIQTHINDTIKKKITKDINNIDFLIFNLYPVFYDIPWKICILEQNIENNFPHTHNDVIFLPYNFEELHEKTRREILTHEKVHVFQRYYPHKTLTLYLEVWKLRVINVLGGNPSYVNSPYEMNSLTDTIRSNPDVNKICFAFYNPKRDSFCHYLQIYKSGASKLSHSKAILFNVNESALSNQTSKNLRYYTHVQHLIETNEQYEHPNETMACLLTKLFLYEDLTDKFTKTWANTSLKNP